MSAEVAIERLPFPKDPVPLLWLGVWERNSRAIAFYYKAGHVDVGAHVFVVGTDPRTDRILIRSLALDGAA